MSDWRPRNWMSSWKRRDGGASLGIGTHKAWPIHLELASSITILGSWDSEELRSVYHFIKRCFFDFFLSLFIYLITPVSMTTLHHFLTSRESILPIWSTTNQQTRLSNPSTCATDLFDLLHGMLIYNENS